jgi:hypothetical protein
MITPQQFLESFLQEKAAAWKEARPHLTAVYTKYFGERRYVSAEHSDVGIAYSTSTGRPEIGWLIFCSGILSGLVLLGFARVIQNTFESSQRLRRLEILMERDYDKKRAT